MPEMLRPSVMPGGREVDAASLPCPARALMLLRDPDHELLAVELAT